MCAALVGPLCISPYPSNTSDIVDALTLDLPKVFFDDDFETISWAQTGKPVFKVEPGLTRALRVERFCEKPKDYTVEEWNISAYPSSFRHHKPLPSPSQATLPLFEYEIPSKGRYTKGKDGTDLGKKERACPFSFHTKRKGNFQRRHKFVLGCLVLGVLKKS